jgi:hypothetical protein
MGSRLIDLHELNPGSGTHFELIAEIPPIQIERFVDARGRFCKREQAAHTIPRQLTLPRERCQRGGEWCLCAFDAGHGRDERALT